MAVRPIVIDTIKSQEKAIRALFLNFGFDSSSANKAWIALLEIFMNL